MKKVYIHIHCREKFAKVYGTEDNYRMQEGFV